MKQNYDLECNDYVVGTTTGYLCKMLNADSIYIIDKRTKTFDKEEFVKQCLLAKEKGLVIGAIAKSIEFNFDIVLGEIKSFTYSDGELWITGIGKEKFAMEVKYSECVNPVKQETSLKEINDLLLIS